MPEVSTDIRFLSDRESAIDYLNNEAIAKTITDLVLEPGGHPITVGVHGDWGAGKSSVLEMLESALKHENHKDKVLCLRFNGWQFQGFEDAKIALIEAVIDGLAHNLTLTAKAKEKLKEVIGSLDWLKIAKKGGPLAFSALTGLPALGIGQLFDVFSDKVSDLISNEDERKNALTELADLKKEKEEGKGPSKSISHEIHAFRHSFKELIKETKLSRLVVLVDDLDRCLPATAIDTLEAIRLFVLMEKTAFVIAADEQMIEYAVTEHFPDLPNGKDGQGYAKAYLEKLIQVPFRVPALGETETRIYTTLLLLGAALGDDQETFNRLLVSAKAALSTPWDGSGLSQDSLRAALGNKFDSFSAVINLAEQISPVLSAGTKGNPRQVKRFLNAMTLRMAVAKARNFGPAISTAALAKIMLAEMFYPVTIFDYVASASANSFDGTCAALDALEGVASGRLSLNASSDANQNASTVPEELREVVNSWAIQPEILRWAKIPPALGATSLKPYLFVIKDKKNYLSAAAPLSPKLSSLFGKLCAGPATAASTVADLSGISPAEVVPLFEALRRTALSSTSFEEKPAALVGLEFIVKAHATFEKSYLDAIQSMPAARITGWAARGYADVVTSDVGKARLEGILDGWRASGGPALKRALSVRDKVPGRPRR